MLSFEENIIYIVTGDLVNSNHAWFEEKKKLTNSWTLKRIATAL